MIRNRIEKYSLRRGNCYCKKSNSIFVNIIFQALPWHVNRSLMILKFSKIFWNRTSMLIWKINLRNVLTFHKILHRLSHFSHSRGLNQLFSETNCCQPILRNKLLFKVRFRVHQISVRSKSRRLELDLRDFFLSKKRRPFYSIEYSLV